MSYILLAFAALLQFSVAQLEVPGRLLARSSTRSVTSFAVTKSCDGVSVYSTCSDCNNVLVCLGSIVEAKNCSKTTPDTPFCVNGACSAMPNMAEGCVPNLMNCSGVGFFPDPKNCQIYHYCEQINQNSSVYGCPPDYVYNAETKLCRLKTSAADCVTVKCDLSKIFVNYGTSKQFFAFCQYEAGFVQSIRVLKCATYASFDGLSCVFTCPREGNFAHTVPTKFYQCYTAGGKLVYQIQSCTGGKTFDQGLTACVTPKPVPVPVV